LTRPRVGEFEVAAGENVPGVELLVSTDEWVAVVREERERSQHPMNVRPSFSPKMHKIALTKMLQVHKARKSLILVVREGLEPSTPAL
jgi:hypothetical protein